MEPLILEVLKHEGVATLVTSGPSGPHVVATWNSYLEQEEKTFLIPAGGFRTTEENIRAGSKLVMLIGSREVQGKSGPGAGFRLSGSAEFLSEGRMFEKTKRRFRWARAVLVVKVEKTEQLL